MQERVRAFPGGILIREKLMVREAQSIHSVCAAGGSELLMGRTIQVKAGERSHAKPLSR